MSSEWSDLTEDEKAHMRFVFPGIAGAGVRFITKEESDQLLKTSQDAVNMSSKALERFVRERTVTLEDVQGALAMFGPMTVEQITEKVRMRRPLAQQFEVVNALAALQDMNRVRASDSLGLWVVN